MTDALFHLVWLSGTNCDGCTIKALGDTSGGGLEALLTGAIAGLPRVRLHHPVLSPESGAEFVGHLERAARGELGAYGVINEGSIPDERRAGEGFFSGLGGDGGARPITHTEWLERLAPSASFVAAWGDCAVWGGPHALAPNPIGATGTGMLLGVDYRSTLGLPVINLPGCAAPPVLTALLVELLAFAFADGPPPELDDLRRPRAAYRGDWEGAFVAWGE